MDSTVPVIVLHDDDLKVQTIITLDNDKSESKVPIVTLEDDCSTKNPDVNIEKNNAEIIIDDEECLPIDLDTEDPTTCVVLDADSDIDMSEIITLEDEQATTSGNTTVHSPSSRNSSVAISPDIYPLNVDNKVSTNTTQKNKHFLSILKKSIHPKIKIEKLSDETQIVSSSNRKPYVCDICKEIFLEKNVFASHLKTHNSEKPYVCDICFKEFKDKKILRMHYNTHTGEKPFACTICDKVYSNTVSLRKHYKIHTGEKPYVCDVCLLSFDQKSSLCDHKIEKHNFLTVL